MIAIYSYYYCGYTHSNGTIGSITSLLLVLVLMLMLPLQLLLLLLLLQL
jgi:hypothetical protein